MRYPEYFKNMHNLCALGFEKTLSFLEFVKQQNKKCS